MAVGGRGFTARINESEINRFLTGPSGVLGRTLRHAAEIVARGQKRRCPVSPHGSPGHKSGTLRSSIGWQPIYGSDPSHGVRIGPSAVTDEGAPYGLFVELGTAPHTITPKNATALHWIGPDGQDVFAQSVEHPGTAPQPFIVPALDDLRGKAL